MRKFLLVLFTLGIAGLSFPQLVCAQTWEFGASLGASVLQGERLGRISIPVLTGNSSLENGFRVAFRGTYNPNSFLGHELVYSYNDSGVRFAVADAVRDANIHQFGYNLLVYPLPRSSPVRPFLTAGAHLSRFSEFSDAADLSEGLTKPGFNWGGGLKWKVLPLFLVRFDFRQYLSGKPYRVSENGTFRLNEISVGISLNH